MDTRFNSFYHEEMHPFVTAMVGLLAESGARAQRPGFVNYLMLSSQKKYDSDIAYLRAMAQEVVNERRTHPSDKKDLLNAMITGRDPKTGEGLTDASIINNMITFLIAGEFCSFNDNIHNLTRNRTRDNQRDAIVSLLLPYQNSSGLSKDT